MGVINILSFLLIFLVLILELYTNFIKPNLLRKGKIPKVEMVERYYLTFPPDLNLAEKLLKERITFSFSPSGIYVAVNSTQNMEKLLNLYKTYKENLNREKIAKQVVISFIKKDLDVLNKEYEESLQNYQKLYNLFTSRGIKIDFVLLKQDVLKIQEEIYKGYKNYWNKKLEQIEKNYSIEVKKPSIRIGNVLEKAKNIYNEELKFNLFQLYLNTKILEAHIAADLYKLKEFSNGMGNNH